MKKLLAIIISTILICGCMFAFIGCDDGEDNPPLPVEYTVKFDLNGGSGSIDDRVIREGEKLSEPAEPVREGFTFDGWFTAANGGTMWNFSADTVTKEITLYAHWTERKIEDKRFSFRAIEEGGITVGYAVSGIGDVDDTDIVIPNEYNGLPVTQISDYAFYENGDITSVKIFGGITEIGDSAFWGCEKLESLVIEAKISSMGELAFAHCQKLETVRIGDGVEEISYYAFFECSSIKEVTIPASVKTIGESAFAFCTSLEEVNFSEGLEYIGDCAFGGCSSLKEFVMPQSVTEIGFGVLMFIGGFFFDGEEYDSFNVLEKIVMSDNIVDIPDFAFSGCAISTISVGKKVEIINYSAFYGCESLQSVVIPKSVKQIISYAFYRCPMLSTVFYEGTAEEWGKVSVSRSGNDIANAEVFFYSETKPAGSGNFWHYASDGTTPLMW